MEKDGSRAEKTNATSAADKARIVELEAVVESLNRKVEVGVANLAAFEATKGMFVQNAKLAAVESMSRELMQRYKDGLRDGASLSHGNGVTSPDTAFVTPN